LFSHFVSHEIKYPLFNPFALITYFAEFASATHRICFQFLHLAALAAGLQKVNARLQLSKTAPQTV
jgi:hypothetical protein